MAPLVDTYLPEAARPGDCFEAKQTVWNLEGVLLIQQETAPFRYERSAEKVRFSAIDHWQITFLRTGKTWTSVNGHVVENEPGMMEIRALGCPFYGRTISAQSVTLILPCDLFADHGGLPGTSNNVVLGGARVKLVSSYVSFLEANLGRLTKDDLHGVRQQLEEMIFHSVAPLVPIGLGLGRLGNFINGELWGKPGTVPWAMLFPNAHSADVDWAATHPQWQATLMQYGGLPRHPSQLYEMLLEGVVMFTVLFLVSLKPRPRYLVSGLFALLYGCFRFGVEFVRVPDPQLGYLAWGWLTMGQIQSLPLIVIGLVLVWMSRKAPTMRLYNVSLPTKE